MSTWGRFRDWVSGRRTPAPTVASVDPPPPLPSVPPRPVSPIDWPRMDWWSRDVGMTITPERIISIFRQAERGWPEMQCDLFDRVRQRDGKLRSAFAKRKAAVAGKRWIVQAGGDTDQD